MNKNGKIISSILALTLTLTMCCVIPALATNILNASSVITQSVSASHRLAGIDRYSTAVAISQKGWLISDTVILASGEDYADALTSGPLAKKYNAPILLTSKASLSTETITEIGRLKAKNIIIIGREGAISLGVETQLTAAGFSSITRIGGDNRYETSTMVAARLDKPRAVVIVPGQGFADALSVSSIASKLGYSIILSEKSGLSDSAKKYIETNRIKKAYIIGGQAVLSSSIENQVSEPERLSGLNRYETNLEVLKAFAGEYNYDNVFIATGNKFADALSGAALASKTSSPMILVQSSMNADSARYLVSKENLNTKILALGGESAVSNSIVKSAIDSKSTIAVTKNYSSVGTYEGGSISGSVIISAAGVNLKNATISGDLLIASTVGDGNVDLDNVTVAGKTIVSGGGANSVKLHNMHSKSVEIDKASGETVRVVTDATSSIDTLLVSTNAIVDQTLSTRKGNITLESKASVILRGGFETVEVNGQGTTVNIIGGAVAKINVNATSRKSIIDLDVNSSVAKLNVNASVTVSGTGKITNANIGANGTTMAITPLVTSVMEGISVLVNGDTKDSSNSIVITSLPIVGSVSTAAYVAIGDSISTGYGLTYKNNDLFVNKLAIKTGKQKLNLAIDGLTTTELIGAIHKFDASKMAAIANTGLITLSIGGNNLLQPFITALTAKLGKDPTTVSSVELNMAIASLLLDPTALRGIQSQMTLGVGSFISEFPTIISALKAINPNATIIVQTIYNPYDNIPGLESLALIPEEALTQMNEVIRLGASTATYKVADVYTAFKMDNNILTNALTFDIHPNAIGHNVIYMACYRALTGSLPYSTTGTVTNGTVTLITNPVDLTVHVTVIADSGYVVPQSVSISIGGQLQTLDLVNGEANIPASRIKGDIIITGSAGRAI